MEAFGAAFAVVILAELADKSQLLAIAFATRYAWRDVIGGIAVATLLNQLLATLAGFYLGSLIDQDLMYFVASIAFVGFAIWTLRKENDDIATAPSPRHPMLTVATAFFLAELGDKTQLATITIAASYQAIVPVLLGSTCGMLIADGLCIVAGSALRRIIPDTALKVITAAIFFAIGAIGIYDWLVSKIL